MNSSISRQEIIENLELPVRKHTDDLKVLRPTAEEIRIAALFCLERDPHPTSRRDLVQVIGELGFEVDEVLEDID